MAELGQATQAAHPARNSRRLLGGRVLSSVMDWFLPLEDDTPLGVSWESQGSKGQMAVVE